MTDTLQSGPSRELLSNIATALLAVAAFAAASLAIAEAMEIVGPLLSPYLPDLTPPQML